MTFDFRASQLRTSKIIASGSTGTNAQLLVYPIGADGTPANQGNINPVVFKTGSIGQDVWFFVSGAIGSLDGTQRKVAAFGGDVHISGNLRVGTYLFSTVTGSINNLNTSVTSLSNSLNALSSSVAGGGFTAFDTVTPTTVGFAAVGFHASASRGDHSHGLPNGVSITDQTVYTGSSVWTTTASSPASGVGSFQTSGSARFTVAHNDTLAFGYDGTEPFLGGIGPRIERPLIAQGMMGLKTVVRTRLKAQTGGPTNQFGAAGGGFYVRNIDDTAHQRISVDLFNGLAPGNTPVNYGGTGGSTPTTYSSVIPWDGTTWLEIEILNANTLSFGIIQDSVKTTYGPTTISFAPSHFGIYALSMRDCSFTLDFDLPEEQLFVAPTTLGLGLLTSPSASAARDLLGVGSTDPTWIASGSNFKTTSSVAISPDGGYATAHGSDNYFYVSSSGTNKAVFGGTVHFSGNVETEGNFGPIQVGTATTTNATPTVVWSTTLSNYSIQNINLSLVGKQTNNVNIARFSREFTVFKNTGTASFGDSINAYVPDFQTTGSWGFSLELSGSDMKVYATGSAGVNVFWKCQAVVNGITSN